METPREKISKALAKYFTNVKESTLNSYVSVVKKLFEYSHFISKTEPNLDNISFEVLNDPKLVSEYIAKYQKDYGKPMPITTHRNIYSILMKMFPDTQEFRSGFNRSVQEIKTEDPNTKSEREADNWLSFAEVKAVFEREYSIYKLLLESNVPVIDITDLSNFILLAVSSGVFIPPRRSQDWTEMRIRNYTREDNYYEKGKFYFNKYKTADTYGRQVVLLPKELNKIIKQYIKKNPNDYLIVNHSGGKLNESGVAPRLNKIFDGKKISTTMLRHIYLSEFHKDTPSLKQMEQVAHDMGHSVSMGLGYVKR